MTNAEIEQVRALRRRGWSIPKIARELGSWADEVRSCLFPDPDAAGPHEGDDAGPRAPC